MTLEMRCLTESDEELSLAWVRYSGYICHSESTWAPCSLSDQILVFKLDLIRLSAQISSLNKIVRIDFVEGSAFIMETILFGCAKVSEILTSQGACVIEELECESTDEFIIDTHVKEWFALNFYNQKPYLMQHLLIVLDDRCFSCYWVLSYF